MAQLLINFYKIKIGLLIVCFQSCYIMGSTLLNQIDWGLGKDSLEAFINIYNHDDVSRQEQAGLIESCIRIFDPIENRKKQLLEKVNKFSNGEELRLSIVIDCFGGFSYLPDLLDSIFSQKVDFNYEVICIGNVSSPIFSSSLDSYSKKYKNLLIFPSNHDAAGFGDNNAFMNCRSELILYLSHRDILPPSILQRLVNMFLNTKVDVVVLNNIIALYKGEFSSVPRHDKFYTTCEMGQLSYNLLDVLRDKDGMFTWGVKYGPCLFTKAIFIECGGIVGPREKFSHNLGIMMLLKGYRFNILSNGFCYQYYEDGNWFNDIFRGDYSEQIKTICMQFPEFLANVQINKLNLLDKQGSLVGLPWIPVDLIRKIILAYQFEREGKYQQAYSQYLSVIRSDDQCHIKIYLKCIRAFLLANNTENEDSNIQFLVLNMQKYLDNKN